MAHGAPTDEELAASARRGDPASIDVLARRFAAPVHAICRKLLGHPADAEDACQEVFVRLCRELGKYDPSRPFAPWLFKMTTNIALNFHRSRQRRADREARELPAPAPAPGARGEEIDRITAAIESLPPKYGLALIYKFRQQLTNGQIGELMDLPADSVRVVIFRALAMVRERVGSA